MKKPFYFYISLFLTLSLLPSAGLIFTGIRQPSINQESAPAPALFTDGSLNPFFLGKGFGVSSQERVITGTDGWLFYKDSLADFQGTAPMTGRQLFNVAHSLAMVQAYAQKNGAAFAFAAAPNKNSLYGTYMPYYYQPLRTGKSNLERLEEYLQSEQVNTIDLYQSFRDDGRVLYHKRDSHWNNEGAALAADKILNGLEKEHSVYTDRTYTVKRILRETCITCCTLPCQSWKRKFIIILRRSLPIAKKWKVILRP